MTKPNRALGDQLIEQERTKPALQQRYTQEIQAMYEKQLTGIRRWSWLIAAVMGVGVAIGFGTLSVALPEGFPLLARLTFAAGALCGLAWAVLGYRVYRRGAFNLKFDNLWGSLMGAGLPLLVAIVLMVSAPDSPAGLRMMITGVFWLVFATIFIARYAIDSTALQTREKLLEFEYRLAELAERLESGGPGRQ